MELTLVARDEVKEEEEDEAAGLGGHMLHTSAAFVRYMSTAASTDLRV
jgi:hypothetical protein